MLVIAVFPSICQVDSAQVTIVMVWDPSVRFSFSIYIYIYLYNDVQVCCNCRMWLPLRVSDIAYPSFISSQKVTPSTSYRNIWKQGKYLKAGAGAISSASLSPTKCFMIGADIVMLNKEGCTSEEYASLMLQLRN